ncbi:winged helix DNA-binding domain-containing protein [Agrococcus sp. 1P02AA]|uniref:winged helix DNA-binding domain-containing protein n=1 Tax=Agrococcus sp. 1P02AA TaxID=3132259 RepID=UPI0039A40597
MQQLTAVEARRMRLVAQGLDRRARAGADDGSAASRGASRGSSAGGGAGGAASALGRTPTQVVRRMVAMQGQDLLQVLQAIAIRSAPGTSLDDVRAVFDRGELVRSWAMRGTLFVATPDALASLHAAVAGRMRTREWRMCLDRGIDEAAAERSAAVLVELLADAPQPRPALMAAWEAAGIDVSGGRGYHLLALHSYAGLVRFGPFAGTAQLLVGGAAPAVQGPDAALAEAVRSLVAARAPVSEADIAWWLALPKSTVRAAFARAEGIREVLVGGAPMLVVEQGLEGRRSGVLLVPGFDEWILGYRDRSLTAGAEMHAALVPGNNGVFQPAVLVDGRAVGRWRAARGRGAPTVELIEQVSAATAAAIERHVAAWPHG